MPYDYKTTEEKIQQFWDTQQIYQKTKELHKKGKPFYFLDGPPYTSGKVHLGTAWNKSLKDAVLRYKRMQGFNVWDRAGYDMHGLPTENATEKKLGISGKEDILKFGVEKFIKECEKLCIENMHIMNADFKRLGVWMDFENAYQSIKKEYIEGIWWLIKQAHEKKRLYRGLRTMHWCAESSTAVAKHELEYKEVVDDAIYLKFPLQGVKDTYCLIWTTTPWTIPFNMAIMVHPDVVYAYCKVAETGETWIVAEACAEHVIKGKAKEEFNVIKTVKGKDLAGMRYLHPYHHEIPYFASAKDHKTLHTVVLSSEYVDTITGTGLVHCAPGCGPEDYEIGHRNGLSPFNTVDEQGVFRDCGPFTGLRAKKDDKEFIALFAKKGMIAAKEKYKHDYPHDWRTHDPVIFRTTSQWFFKVEDIKDAMIRENDRIVWNPQAAYNAFNAWLENLRDNSISKQRFWGTPLPIWEADDGEYLVVGSVAELEKLSGKKVTKYHLPWIDEITIKDKQGKIFHRVPDVLDVWVDAGSASWNCLDFPQNKKLFDELFPADFILEGKDQIRGWFNLLMVASMLSMGKPSFKRVYMHGFVQDALGRKMSKSSGNYIVPGEVIDKFGADTFRYYMIGGAAPGLDINYNQDDVGLCYRNLGVLWNLVQYFIDQLETTGLKPRTVKKEKLALEDRYILAKLQETVERTTAAFEAYNINEIPHIVEGLFLEISRTYVQQIRERAAWGSDAEKQTVVDVLCKVISETLVLFAPIAPFVVEDLYQQLRKRVGLSAESVHHCSWPVVEKSFVDEKLLSNFSYAQSVIQAILAGREKLKLGVRWPLKEVVLTTDDKILHDAVVQLRETIMSQTNVKSLRVERKLAGCQETVKPQQRKIGQEYKSLAPKILEHLAKASSKTILHSLEQDGKYVMKLEGKDIVLTSEHLAVERSVPGHYVGVELKHGWVYVDGTRTVDLDLEGYGREIMRRIQTIRKDAKMHKQAWINLTFGTDEDVLREAVLKNIADIKERCGVRELTFVGLKDPAEEVKGKKFSVGYKVVG